MLSVIINSKKEQLIIDMFAAIDGRRFDEMESIFTSNCKYERPGYPAIEGWPSLRRFYEVERLIDRGAHQLRALVIGGEHVCAAGLFEGTLKSGQKTKVEFADTYFLINNKIARRKTYFHVPAV